jgi:hypothetical protein
MVYGGPIPVPAALSPAEFEAARLRIERALIDVETEADRLAGWPEAERPAAEGPHGTSTAGAGGPG